MALSSTTSREPATSSVWTAPASVPALARTPSVRADDTSSRPGSLLSSLRAVATSTMSVLRSRSRRAAAWIRSRSATM